MICCPLTPARSPASGTAAHSLGSGTPECVYVVDFKPMQKPTASRPRTEIVGKNEYFCFGMRDFLGIEASFMQVDLVKRHCFPVYWNGDIDVFLESLFARKGLLASTKKFAFPRFGTEKISTSGLFAARVDLQGSTPELYALFIGEDDTWESWLNVDASGFYGVISFSGNGIKLRCGYSKSQSKKPSQEELHQQKEEEMDDYCSQVPVKHLVFMVHGIGQRLEKSNLVDDAGNFRHITASLAEQHLTTRQRGTQRVLYIPCQWRKRLKLSCETAVEKITLDGVRGFHVMLSATVHDVLYYMSPIYCQDIINSVSNQLNWLYLKFLKRNPGYDGKVSIYGHSLGSVLSYDILSHQENLSSPFPMDWRYKEQQDTIEESSHAMNNQPSNGGSSADLKGKSSTKTNESEDKVGSADEDDLMSVQSTHLEHEEAPAEDFSSLVGTVVSDTATAIDSEQTAKEDMVIN
ncbi:LOW QUALITY PROTEIN: phospholipase SGR2-like [Pistacia vera]|uniref:LOW QUALITY PROTEIN: phospholipase SGR2-like n=1 Tax=Pistacia vera TaxID=55513 RepID=UPI0012630DE2|nr:LOW QUALITY PROTEIN: phospholipase SGR2-like [Pistacia vera]